MVPADVGSSPPIGATCTGLACFCHRRNSATRDFTCRVTLLPYYQIVTTQLPV